MRRGLILLLILGAGGVAFLALGLAPAGLLPRPGGAALAWEFLSAAWKPALDYQADFVPSGAPAFLSVAWAALQRTLVFAAAALSLALLLALPLGILASGLVPARWRLPVRVLIAMMRSVHELMWAVVLLAAFGLTSAAAVVAIAIPFAGTLAKVFSELIDEAPTAAYQALRDSGAGPVTAFFGGLLPGAAPDMGAYAFYRFECAVRSSAVLGFFGFPTLGYYLRRSFENLHYREVWTWLYLIVITVVVLEAWSARMRRRFVA